MTKYDKKNRAAKENSKHQDHFLEILMKSGKFL